MKTVKNIWLWASYDFANSLVSIVFFLYFAQWLVIDRGVSDFSFNITFTISTIMLLFTVPFTGSILDKHLRRITGLRYSTFITMILYGLCALGTIYNKDLFALIFFTLGTYTYILSFTFYTPLIKDISSKKNIGFVSGLGIALNYLGQILGLVIVLPLSTGMINFFGGSPRAETLLPAVIIFTLLSLPMLIFFHEPKKKYIQFSVREKIKETIKETKILLSIKNVCFFLLAYFFFNDAVLTASVNFPLFLEQVWHVSDTIKTFILLGILLTSGLGGMISGKVADKFGHKKTLSIILWGWLIILPAIALSTNFALLVVLTTLMGFWFGASWTVSRSVMSNISPKGKHNLTFAYFGLAERASSFLGPIVWGLVVSGLVNLGSIRYRISTIAVTLFIFLGIFMLSKVKEQKKN